MRLGSQTWLKKSFQIWYLFYPEIIWGLENYSFYAKQKLIPRNPLNSIKIILAARAYGRIDLKIFQEYILFFTKSKFFQKDNFLVHCNFTQKVIYPECISYIFMYLRKNTLLTSALNLP